MIMLSIEQCYNFAGICLCKFLNLCSIKLALVVHQVWNNMLHILHTLYILLSSSLSSLVFVILVWL